MVQGEYRSLTWKMFIWDSWKIMGELPIMHLLMQWMMNFRGSCISKWNFFPAIQVQILSIVWEEKFLRQVSCGLLMSFPFHYICTNILSYHLSWMHDFDSDCLFLGRFECFGLQKLLSIIKCICSLWSIPVTLFLSLSLTPKLDTTQSLYALGCLNYYVKSYS